ncbi:sugar ABC transporter ATP-binding protein [Nordella sp. HKS 07]|uniref:sugar ABC transporter ATP-binding protein n=1 Tax=Nordella sp. HKS 07 TaxID=2712222 RepID=UPI0013E0FBD3|nr:sugar ABC transporter ATP-binding protein [Nordella sp. HKS 07]
MTNSPASGHVLGPPLLSLSNISKRFGGTLALDTIDWSVAAGEVHCLVGENGSGKSTLIKILSGVHAPDAGGAITLDGVSHPYLTPHLARQLGIQVIFQDLSLFPNLTVEENIAIGLELSVPLKPPPRKLMRDAARAALIRLDAHLPLDTPVGRLPVAQRQIVAICRGLAANARILFMDEPTASLTRHEVDLLLASVRRLKQQGVSIVFVSHRLDEIVEIAERVTVLRDGRKVGTFPVAEIDDNRLAELMTGESLEHTLSAKPMSGRRPVLEVSAASRVGEFEDVSFTLHEGEILGLIGLLGAGRTELALSLFGMSRLDSGGIAMDGRRLTSLSNKAAIAAGIAYASEDRLSLGINLRQSIADNMAVTVLGRLRNLLGLIPFGRRAALARSWIDRLNIRTPGVDVAAQTLSGGNQQRVVLAKWLATQPKVLILDGPTIGVDIRNKAGIHRLVRSLANKGMAILVISDEVPEVYFNCDRVLHMRNGSIVGEFVPGTASKAQLSEALYA